MRPALGALMGPVVGIVIPVFALVLCGWAFARWDLLPPGGARGIGVFVFNLAIPALLFRAMARGLPAPDDAWGLIAAYFGGCAAMFLIAEPIGRFVFRLDAPERTVLEIGRAHV